MDDDYHTPEITSRIQEEARFPYRYFETLLGPRYGVRWKDMYMPGANPMKLSWEFSITSELFPITMFGPGAHPFPSRYASRFTTMIAEINIFLPALIDDFRSRGGAIEVRAFADPASLLDLEAPLIVNCTGLGAKALFGDPELTPAQGTAHHSQAANGGDLRLSRSGSRPLHVLAERRGHSRRQPRRGGLVDRGRPAQGGADP
jgi:D-amino-acid oxidase